MIIRINNKKISENSPTYFIADIAANHDGSLLRAKRLIRLAAKAGANGAKFQHFKADTIVNKEQFDKKKKTAHQSKWTTSVYDVYKNASINKPETTVARVALILPILFFSEINTGIEPNISMTANNANVHVNIC